MIDVETMSELLKKPEETHDAVNHPAHYTREGGMECIEEMEMIYGTKALMLFCLMNAHKYRYRASEKNGEEDLKKSDWYMNKADELAWKLEEGGGNAGAVNLL